MWKDLSEHWQTAFTEAWTAYCEGNIPIGAVLVGEDGEQLVRDHNRIRYDSRGSVKNMRLSHAEMNVLRLLDASVYEPRSLTLYTTMEPCPMCMGTAVMSNICHLRSAARDPYCGMMHLADTDPYYRSKSLDYTFEGGEKEFVQIVIQSVFELRNIAQGAGDGVLNRFRDTFPEAVSAAESLYSSGDMDAFRNSTAAEVYDAIAGRYAL
ncbi:MAG: nucleoside deaminase [Oscillospiraceae bacterium]|nr:nucleoside deaminase [Oscillospiraceae bacterium]